MNYEVKFVRLTKPRRGHNINVWVYIKILSDLPSTEVVALFPQPIALLCYSPKTHTQATAACPKFPRPTLLTTWGSCNRYSESVHIPFYQTKFICILYPFQMLNNYTEVRLYNHTLLRPAQTGVERWSHDSLVAFTSGGLTTMLRCSMLYFTAQHTVLLSWFLTLTISTELLKRKCLFVPINV